MRMWAGSSKDIQDVLIVWALLRSSWKGSLDARCDNTLRLYAEQWM